MLVKTFKAGDMPEAMRMVKTEFGPDAMIISSRKEKRRGIMRWYAKPVYEVTAALERLPDTHFDPPAVKGAAAANTLDEFRTSMLAPLARELKELRARVENLSLREESGNPLRNIRENEIHEFDPEPETFKRTESMLAPCTLPSSEVEELKKVLLRSMATKDHAKTEVSATRLEQTGSKAEPRKLEALTAELRASGIGEEEIRTLMVPVSAAAARGEEEERLRETLKESITASIQCALRLKLKGETRILAMVGPTGVGKTTTIAKLAARAYKHGVKVALITIDTFRIGAVEQLQTYSGIMGLPLEVASTPAELAEALAAHSDKQLILIDTAGRSPRDREKLQEMRSFLEVHPDIEVHLCLSATTRDNELDRIVARFGVLPVSRLLFTKLDESESFGCIVNMHMRDKFPLSYFTTGQKVPEDIEAATSVKVAGLIIGEIKP